MNDLASLLEQQQQLTTALLSRLAEPVDEESEDRFSRSVEFEQNVQLIHIRKTEGIAAWRKAHNAVMADRKKKMRRFSRKKKSPS